MKRSLRLRRTCFLFQIIVFYTKLQLDLRSLDKRNETNCKQFHAWHGILIAISKKLSGGRKAVAVPVLKLPPEYTVYSIGHSEI